MESFKQLLLKLDETLKKHNAVNYRKLQEPFSSKEIDEYMKKLRVKDENFRLFYKWKNGIKKENGIAMRDKIFDFGIQLSLQSLAEDLDYDFDLWTNNFIPIVMDGSGSGLLFNNEKGKEYGKICLYSVALLHTEPISYYDSMETMIITAIKAYSKQILKYDDEENWLNKNIDEFYKLAPKYNPNSDYWKLPENFTTSPQS